MSLANIVDLGGSKIRPSASIHFHGPPIDQIAKRQPSKGLQNRKRLTRLDLSCRAQCLIPIALDGYDIELLQPTSTLRETESLAEFSMIS